MASAALGAWRKAVGQSHAFRELIAQRRLLADRERLRLAIAIRLDETWARSYAQYIAIRSADAALMADLDALRHETVGGVYHPFQWTDDDFRPIATVIDALFEALGWIT